MVEPELPKKKEVLKQKQQKIKEVVKEDSSSEEDTSLRTQMIKVCDKKPKQHPGFLPTQD